MSNLPRTTKMFSRCTSWLAQRIRRSTITPHYRLDFRGLGRTCAFGQTPLRGIVRIWPVLWFCDKHRARPCPADLVLSRAVLPVFQSCLLRKTTIGGGAEGWGAKVGGGRGNLGLHWLRWSAAMSEKYMSIGAPMTELPVAQPRGYTSHSHRWTCITCGVCSVCMYSCKILDRGGRGVLTVDKCSLHCIYLKVGDLSNEQPIWQDLQTAFNQKKYRLSYNIFTINQVFKIVQLDEIAMQLSGG